MDRVTIKELLDRISDGNFLWKTIHSKRNEWIGHLIRYKGLLKLIIRERRREEL